MNEKMMASLVLLLTAVCLFSGCVEDDESDKDTIYDVWMSFMEYTTPNHPDVINITYEILGNDTDDNLTPDDVTKVQRWIHDNIRYKMQEEAYLANETLESRVGDCNDFASLEYSILSFENNGSADIYYVYIDFAYRSPTGYKELEITHICILVVFDDVLFFSDPTFQDLNDDIEHTFKPITNMSRMISTIMYWSDLKKLDVRGVFSDSCFSEFEDNDEFYEWCDYQLNRDV